MTNYLLIVEHFLARASSASPAAQAKSRDPGRDKSTPRANHQKSVKPVWKKYSDFPKSQISLCSARLTR
jgi:hypothetical protein